MTPAEHQIGRSPAIDFRIGQVSVKPVLDDIRNLRAEALVDSTRTAVEGRPLHMSKWVRAADTDGAIGKALSRHMPLRLGNIIVTNAGVLKAKYILHAIVLDWKQDSAGQVTVDQKIVSGAARRCVRLAAALDVGHGAFTAASHSSDHRADPGLAGCKAAVEGTAGLGFHEVLPPRPKRDRTPRVAGVLAEMHVTRRAAAPAALSPDTAGARLFNCASRQPTWHKQVNTISRQNQ